MDDPKIRKIVIETFAKGKKSKLPLNIILKEVDASVQEYKNNRLSGAKEEPDGVEVHYIENVPRLYGPPPPPKVQYIEIPQALYGPPQLLEKPPQKRKK